MQNTNSIKQFINEVIAEMKNVRWPTRKMAVGSTIAVLLISIIVAAYLGVLDIELKKALAYIVTRF